MDALFSSHWHYLDCTIPTAPSHLTQTWVYPWLCEADSMTAKIQAVCQQTFKVSVLQHRFVSASALASASLEIARNASLLQREVLLCDGDTPLVFACSLLPEQALSGRYAELRQLGSRPLGHWLFTEPVLKRSAMQYAILDTTNTLFQSARQQTRLPTQLCGRKSLFIGAKHPFLVSEFFLPALMQRQQPQRY